MQAGNKEIVQILLDHDAFVNATAANGWTPLSIAKQRGYSEMSDLFNEKRC